MFSTTWRGWGENSCECIIYLCINVFTNAHNEANTQALRALVLSLRFLFFFFCICFGFLKNKTIKIINYKKACWITPVGTLSSVMIFFTCTLPHFMFTSIYVLPFTLISKEYDFWHQSRNHHGEGGGAEK